MNFYVITLTQRTSQEARNVIVNGTELSVVVYKLKPATTYDVTIIVRNDLGPSTASPLTSFNTIGKMKGKQVKGIIVWVGWMCGWGGYRNGC